MTTLLESRVHSAYPRNIRRSSTISQSQSSTNSKRPVTSKAPQRSHTDVLQMPAWRTMSSTTSSEPFAGFQRSKTDSIDSLTTRRLSVTYNPANELNALLRSLDRDDKFIVQVDCLADYRRLVHTINLRRTPIDSKSLCALQQRENRIVQKNATNDTRFQSLLNALEPKHIVNKETNESIENIQTLTTAMYPVIEEDDDENNLGN